MNAVENEALGAPFKFEHKGRTYTLRPASQIKTGVLRKLTKETDELKAMFSVVESVADSRAMAAIDDMTLEEFAKVFKAWQEHSGVGLGE
jgi:hypothetical protein